MIVAESQDSEREVFDRDPLIQAAICLRNGVRNLSPDSGGEYPTHTCGEQMLASLDYTFKKYPHLLAMSDRQAMLKACVAALTHHLIDGQNTFARDIFVVAEWLSKSLVSGANRPGFKTTFADFRSAKLPSK